MKPEALGCEPSVSCHNHVGSLFLKEHHWVIFYALTSKTKAKWGYQRDIQQHIQKCLRPCRESLCHYSFLFSIISNLIAVSPYHTVTDQIKGFMCKILHKFQGCITFQLRSSGMICFTLYAHHPYIPTVPKTWRRVFKQIVNWNDHRVNTLDLFRKREMERCYRTNCASLGDLPPPDF